jgi:hypothetical protein
MRTTTKLRLLLLPAALMMAACEDSDSPFEPATAPAPAAPAEVPSVDATPALADQRWADGYAVIDNPTATPFTPPSDFSYNRAGGRISVQRPAGSTGRYIVTFAGLSAALGTKSTVHVTSGGVVNSYCKPMTGTLVSDKVEVRCFYTNGTPANSEFTILVLRKAGGRAFAFGNQPTTASYAPAASGSYNPAGTTKVVRLGVGNYHVQFNNLGAQLGGKSGHVQVNAVASGKAWCKTAEEWGGNPHLSVLVQCYTTGGLPVDARFTVLFQLPSAHLAYAYANLPSLSSYKVSPFWSSNPAGGDVVVNRINVGEFTVSWAGADPHIIGMGNVQVTALGLYDNAQCIIEQLASDGVVLKCFAANGAPVDVPFTVLLGS